MLNPAAKPVILKETPATAHVDGQNGLGMTVGNFCMDLAIKKAKQVGVGWVAAKSKPFSPVYFTYEVLLRSLDALFNSSTTSVAICSHLNKL